VSRSSGASSRAVVHKLARDFEKAARIQLRAQREGRRIAPRAQRELRFRVGESQFPKRFGVARRLLRQRIHLAPHAGLDSAGERGRFELGDGEEFHESEAGTIQRRAAPGVEPEVLSSADWPMRSRWTAQTSLVS